MTTLKLYLSPVATQYLKYYHDSPTGKPIPISRSFRELIKALTIPLYSVCEDGDDTQMVSVNFESNFEVAEVADELLPLECPEGKEELRLDILTRDYRYNFDARKSVYIPNPSMQLLDELITRLFEHEINVTVDLFISIGKLQKDAIYHVFDKYGIDGNVDYSFDRAHKMNQRHRANLNFQV